MMKGLSGGERKRTSIGVEMIVDPDILFLDEPTSGLDSFTSQKIVKILKKMAGHGKAIVSTIHQPNSATFGLFDRLILMAEGNIIYQGPAKNAVNYFRTIGFVVPMFSNPADYFLKEFYIPYRKNTIDKNKVKMLVDNYAEHI